MYANFDYLEYIIQFSVIAATHFILLVIPGPDFCLICRNSIAYGKKAGIYTSLGIAVGILIHVNLAIWGVTALINESILASFLQFFGGCYLMYLGIGSWKYTPPDITKKGVKLSLYYYARQGFLCNISNVKAIIFFVSMFSSILSKNTPIALQFLVGGEIIIVNFVAFAFLASLINSSLFRTNLLKIQKQLNRLFSSLLMLLGFLIIWRVLSI